MKNLIIIILITATLQSCRICCNGNPKHYNARNLTDRVCIDTLNLPVIISITDVVGKEVEVLSDGVYIVTLSDNTKVKIIN